MYMTLKEFKLKIDKFRRTIKIIKIFAQRKLHIHKLFLPKTKMVYGV